MFYFILGCLTILLPLAILKKRKSIRMRKIAFRQSSLHLLVKPMLPSNAEAKMLKKTQSKIHDEQNVVKVLRNNNMVYWVEDNVFYSAKMVNGEFDPSTAEKVDTENLSTEEVKELLFILDNLKNGK